MKKCIECGEEGTEPHPQFPADRLCINCLVAYWEEEIIDAEECLGAAKLKQASLS